MQPLRKLIANALWSPRKKTAYGVDWYVDFMRLAAEEDSATGGVTVENAYNRIAWLNIAVCARARNLARSTFRLYSGDTEIEGGPEYDLFNAGVYGMTKYQLWEQTEGWRLMRGEAFWLFDANMAKMPTTIAVSDPAYMKDVRDKSTGKVVSWLWDRNGIKIPFKLEEVIHFPMWNPNDSLRGQSEFLPLSYELDQEHQVAKGHSTLLKNQAIPAGVITIPGDESSAEIAERAIERWEKKHKGVSRAGSTAVLGSGATYERIAMTPAELQTMEVRGWNRDTILAKMGVPHAAVGLKDAGSTLSGKDTTEQMRAFWNLTLIPDLKYFEEKLKRDFFGRFGLKMEGRFDLSDIPELQEDENQRIDRNLKEVQAGTKLINEVREELDREPVPWGDTWWMQFSLVPAENREETLEEDREIAREKPTAPTSAEADEEEKPAKAIEDLVAKTIAKPKIYTPEYRTMHWEMVIKTWEAGEGPFAKDIKDWLYKRRQHTIHTLMTEGKERIASRYLDPVDPDWNEQQFKAMAEKHMKRAVGTTGEQMGNLFDNIGLGGISFDIWDTRAVERLAARVNKGTLADLVPEMRDRLRSTIQEGIETGLSEEHMGDAIRARFNQLSSHANTIARTELGGVINDSRIESFLYVGAQEHEWLSAKDEKVRQPPESPFNHAIDGERRKIGETFPTGGQGLMYPNDPGGEPGNIINCRCLTLPILEGEA